MPDPRVTVITPAYNAGATTFAFRAMDNTGFASVGDVRQGKFIEIDLKETDRAKAKSAVDQMCAKLLANTVIENYAVDLVE